jgi:predicted porin
VSDTNNTTLEEDLAMLTTKAPRFWFAALAGVLAIACYPTPSRAADDPALKEQIRILKQRIDELNQQVDALAKKEQQDAAAAAAAAAAKPAPAPAVGPPAEPKFEAFMKDQKDKGAEPKLAAFLKGFYGTLDVSFDDVTKGIAGMQAYGYSLVDPNNPNSGFVQGGLKVGPVGRVGYLPALSTNKSQIGYRFSHKIADTSTDFMVQVETALAITASPGLKTSYTQQSNVVNGAIGLGDTFVGLQDKGWGTLKFGTMYSPYKKSTDRMNPFSGMLGDYAVVMGNSGGDNRVEFGTRLDHSITYESPKLGGLFNVDLLVSPGANRTYDNVVQSAGSPDCSGSNNPGSGNLLLNCDDGGFGDAYSIDLRFETGPFYATAAYERHKDVNRNSDGIGSNNPIYGYYASHPLDPTSQQIIDFATFNTIVAEFPEFAAIASPPYLNDVVDETAFKVGAQYAFPMGLTVSGIWEQLKRDVPPALVFQNERQRNGTWFAATQKLTAADTVSIGWAHAGRTPGDPGGQHNYNPTLTDDSADMYTIAWKHNLDKQLYWYIDSALTINHGNVHYDIGAGGRGLTTDCHDGTNTIFTDGSSAGPTTWGGCRLLGFSTGLDYKF